MMVCSENGRKPEKGKCERQKVRMRQGQIQLGKEGCSRRGKNEGNILFNDALNTFYLQLYGMRHMIKDHS